MTQNRFVGTWRLVSAETRTSDGQITYPWGRDALGYLVYNTDGYMMVAIMSCNPTKFASSDPRGGSVEEKAAAFDTFLSYGGRYEVKGDRVIHHMEVCSYPDWAGDNQERFFEFHDDRLELHAPPVLFHGKQQTGHLIWQRVRIR
jgi:hypothetical protein